MLEVGLQYNASVGTLLIVAQSTLKLHHLISRRQWGVNEIIKSNTCLIPNVFLIKLECLNRFADKFSELGTIIMNFIVCYFIIYINQNLLFLLLNDEILSVVQPSETRYLHQYKYIRFLFESRL